MLCLDSQRSWNLLVFLKHNGMVQSPPYLLCDWPSLLRETNNSCPMTAHVSSATAKRWKEAAWETPPTRSTIGYVARRAGTTGPKEGDYDSRRPHAGTPLRMRMGGASKLLYIRGAEGLETAVGSWQVENQVGRGSRRRRRKTSCLKGEEGGRKRGGGGGELSGASSQRGDEFVCPRLRLRPGLGNWELGLERHPWKWEEVALGL